MQKMVIVLLAVFWLAIAAPASAQPDHETPSDEFIASVIAPWTGDLDRMVDRRYLRVLVTFSKTNYFVDRAEHHGLTYEAGTLFEPFLNDRLKTTTANRLQVVFIPVSRDRIFEALAQGRGDIAAARLTITPERRRLVDFAPP